MNGGETKDSDVYADDFLYDLEKDPYEIVNLINDESYKSIKEEMRESLLFGSKSFGV